MAVKVVFVTVCGGGTAEEAMSEYNYLLGSIEHHATMGSHIVLDTSPPQYYINARGLPSSVRWVQEPLYNNGRMFRMWSALKRVSELAESMCPDVIVHLDSDEFYTKEWSDSLFKKASKGMVEVLTFEWREGKAYDFGTWHRRAWPGQSGVTIGLNVGWQQHPDYNGNPENHPFPVPPVGMPIVRVEGFLHHHIGMTVGQKKSLRGGADIPWWPAHQLASSVAWPTLLKSWRDEGVPPFDRFK